MCSSAGGIFFALKAELKYRPIIATGVNVSLLIFLLGVAVRTSEVYAEIFFLSNLLNLFSFMNEDSPPVLNFFFFFLKNLFKIILKDLFNMCRIWIGTTFGILFGAL